MIDFHSHIIPNIDDGSKSIEMSLEMLKNSYAQGVNCVVSTSHCYVTDEKSIDAFIKIRNENYNKLEAAMKSHGGKFPKIVLGCEVHLFHDISGFKNINKLCIQGTNYIMIEMPYNKWHSDHYDALYSLTLKGFRPIMAHIERFSVHEADFGNLYSLDLLYQVNAEGFLSATYKGFIPKLFNNRAVHIVGSDMHDTTKRVSNMKKAFDKILRVYGSERVDYLDENAKCILRNEPVESRDFPKLSVWKKIIL